MENTLILGGTGTTGRRIAERLRASGRPVRAAARHGGDVHVDLGDPGTWAAALDSVSAAYLIEPDVQAASTDGAARIPRFVTEAVAGGVRRLVLLTAAGAGHEGHPLEPAEQAVRDSGVAWTILRPTWFAQNFSEGFWRPGILGGDLALPAGNGRTPFLDAEDIAEVATSALTEDRHDGHVYVLTGPRAIGFGEAVDLIARATGRATRYTDVDPEVHLERQVAAGVPRDVARILTGVFTAIRSGEDDTPADGVERALGRPAGQFEDFVATAAAAGAWN